MVKNSFLNSSSLKNCNLNAEYVTPSSINDNEESDTSNLSCWFLLIRRDGLTLDKVPALVLVMNNSCGLSDNYWVLSSTCLILVSL